MNKLFFILVIAFLATAGCSSVARLVVGIHKPKAMDSKELTKWSSKRKIDGLPVFELDTSYNSYIHSIYTDKIKTKNLGQPIMIMYFKEGKLTSLNNNCCFPGVPNLQWNKFGDFNQFPPTCHFPDTAYQQVKLSEIIKYFLPVNQSAIQLNFPSSNYLVVFSCKMLNRQSKNLLSLILEKYSLYSDEIIFVNDDSYIFHFNKQLVLNR